MLVFSQPIILAFVVLFLSWKTRSLITDTTYRVGIVKMKDRVFLDTYQRLLMEAASLGAELVAFPELSILGLPENFTVGDCPCEHTSREYLAVHPNGVGMSKTAKSGHVYVAWNMLELGEPCVEGSPICWYHGRYLYNTEIVLDRQGCIIQKYRKVHAFTLDQVYKSGDGCPRTFTTDFGVKFGVVVCMDMMVHDPAVLYVEELHMTDLILSADWYDFLPMPGPSYFQAWSRFYEVNFLVANNMVVKAGIDSSGAGVFVDGFPLNVSVVKQDAVIVADVPFHKPHHQKKKVNQKKQLLPPTPTSTSAKRQDYYPIENKTYIITTYPGESNSLSLDLESMTCDVSYTISNTSTAKEFVLVLSARYNFQNLLTILYCGFVNCGPTLEFCTPDTFYNTRANAVFEKLRVETTVHDPSIRGKMLPVLGSDKKALFDPMDQFVTSHVSETRTFVLESGVGGVKQPLLFAGHFGVPEKETSCPKKTQ